MTDLFDANYLRQNIDEYVTLIRKHRRLMKILLFKADGSSLEGFRHYFCNRSTTLVKEWFVAMKERHPEACAEFSDMFIHLHSVWMFTLFEEILLRNANADDIERVVTEYIVFEVEGWKSMLKLQNN